MLVERVPMPYVDYLRTAPESQIREWVNEESIAYMPPIEEHQTISGFIGELIKLYSDSFKLGKRIYAPFEVKLWADGPSREPDIIFIAHDNLSILTSNRVEGAPDLVVEIVSPSSAVTDRVTKFSEYQRAGVKEYWLIDPRLHQQQADFYHLDEDGTFQPMPISHEGRFYSTVLAGFWLELGWLWRTPLPKPEAVYADIISTVEGVPEEVVSAYQTIKQWLLRN